MMRAFPSTRSHPAATLRCVPVVVLSSACALFITTDVRSQEGDVLANLRPHSRLLALDTDIARVRSWVKTNPYVGRLRDEAHFAAEQLLKESPVQRKISGGSMLGASRNCLMRVSMLAGMYRLERDPRFAHRATQEMRAAAGFADWGEKYSIDTAEMTAALAIGYDWLFDTLTPADRHLIRTAIIEKGLKSGVRTYRQREGKTWATTRFNFNPVCNGGMLMGALAVAEDQPALTREIITAASQSIRQAMATLAPDGGWPEGPSYWCYALRFMAFFLSSAETALGTDFGLMASPGLADAGLFRIHGVGPTREGFNFANAGAGLPNAFEMMYLSRAFNRPIYAEHQRQFRSDNTIFDLIWYDPRGTKEDLLALPTDAYFRSVDVVFMRSSWGDPNALFVAFKGGDNAADHSHLDLGTFVLDALGQRWAVELGADDYNLPGYWGKKRWTYYRLRTEGQNTLVIDGANQNTKAKAPIVDFYSSPERSFAVADLSQAYRSHAEQVMRGVAMLGGRQVLVQDEIRTAEPIELAWNMHTTAKARIEGRTAHLALNGRQTRLDLIEPTTAAWTVQEVKLEPPFLPLSDTRKIQVRCRIAPPGARIAVLFSSGESAAASRAPVLQPLNAWKPK